MTEKIYRRRKLSHLKSSEPIFAQITPEIALSQLLNRCAERGQDRMILCGDATEDMTREYCNEPLSEWEFARKFIYKYRSPVYRRLSDGYEVSVKLASESWFDKLEDVVVAEAAWQVLKAEWRQTGLPLMSTPATTGMALLWETLPFGDGFPALPDDLARHIRRISPQHRKQKFATRESLASVSVAQVGDVSVGVPIYCYDGRLFYAAMCQRDRFPIGKPRKVGHFKMYEPGFYDVLIRVPGDWNRIGLIPVPDLERAEKFSTFGWIYPNQPGASFRAWAAEPELTFALKQGWEILEVFDGWAFDKGRPLDAWAKKLVEMRERFGNRDHYVFARAAVREILTNTIGRIHKNTVERESIVNHAQWRELIRQWGYAGVRTVEEPGERADGLRLVEHPESNPSDFMVFMPHWSATIYSLARVEVLKYALRINRDHLIEIDGDAVYTTERQRWIEEEDREKVGQFRRKL